VYGKSPRGPEAYIRLQALGKAIVAKHGSASPELDGIRGILDFKTKGALPEQPANSIVLIDEIDKAPRDFPNDLLNEIEKQEFDIRELPAHVPRAKNNARILTLLTSNNEKNLPDAFLRRCIYYYIPFPEGQQLEDIIKAHFPSWDGRVDIAAIKTWIGKVRKLELARKPATGEFIDWLRLLDGGGLLTALKVSYGSLSETDKDRFLDSFGTLVKNNYDIDRVRTAAKNS
jgi:MoxR-like ATPase